jgi:hypothetical protein
MCSNCQRNNKTEWVCRYKSNYYNSHQLSQLNREYLIKIYKSYGGVEETKGKRTPTLINMTMKQY